MVTVFEDPDVFLVVSDLLDPTELPPREPIEYLEIPFRRPVMFLLPLILCVLAAAWAYVVTPRVYESSTLIMLEGEQAPNTLISVSPVERDRLRRVRQEIHSRTRIEKVLAELNPYPEIASRTSTTRLIERMRDAITVSVPLAARAVPPLTGASR